VGVIVTYPCLRIRQWGYGKGVKPTYIYVTAIPLKDLWNADIDRWSRENRYGYQRPPVEARFKTGRESIVTYLLEELGTFPTSVLINVRNDLIYTSKVKVSDEIELGEVTIPDGAKIIIIDGQHRIEALKRACGEKPELENYPLPVSLMNLKDKFDEMVHFYIVNSRQKGIPTDLVYKQLQIFSEKIALGEREWLKKAILGPKERMIALATYVVDFLNEEPESPFSGRIQYVGETREPHHLVRDFTLTQYISKILRERALSGLDPVVLARLLAEYWSAIKELYPSCFEKPLGYTLLKTTGIACFTYLFPTIFSYCARDGDLTKERFKYYLSALREEVDAKELHVDFRRPIDEEWWSTAHGPSIARATGETMFNEITTNMAKKIEIVLRLRGKT
jgi:DGQHR domain-containing protein